MPAIEYGSYYWCVVLKQKEDGSPVETVHLHADHVAIDQSGALTFLSKGRRPAGVEPSLAEDSSKNTGGKSGGEEKKEEKIAPGEMIYFAFAPGSWKLFYAAKLQDGSPASVEHWTNADGRSEASTLSHAGAEGYQEAR